MKAILQRVREARVEVADEVVGQISQGLMVLLCAEQGDTDAVADRLLAKVLKLRVFADDAGKMNRSVQDVAGGLLVVSQFTLAAIDPASRGLLRPRRGDAFTSASCSRPA